MKDELIKQIDEFIRTRHDDDFIPQYNYVANLLLNAHRELGLDKKSAQEVLLEVSRIDEDDIHREEIVIEVSNRIHWSHDQFKGLKW